MNSSQMVTELVEELKQPRATSGNLRQPPDRKDELSRDALPCRAPGAHNRETMAPHLARRMNGVRASRIALATLVGLSLVSPACSKSGEGGTDGGGTGKGGSLGASGGKGGSLGAGTGGGTGTGGSPSDAGRGPTDAVTPPPLDASTSLDGPGVFVAVGSGGRRARSLDDGKTWVDDASLVASGGDDSDLLRTVAWGGGQFIALGYRVMTSPDGKTWHDYGVNAVNQWFGAVLFANGMYVGQGGYGMRATSPDGVTWTDHGIDADTTAAHPADGLVYTSDSGGQFVAVNDNGMRSYSTDGKTWAFSTGVTTVKTVHLAVGNGIAVGVGTAQVVVSTDGGATWSTSAQLGASTGGIVFAQGQFTATAAGHVYVSTDGTKWTDHAMANFNGQQITYGHGTYVNVDANGNLNRSTDGITWTAGTAASSSNGFVTVTFGPSP